MVSLSNHVAISLRLNTRRQTTIATATRLPPPYQVRGRNDKSPHPKIRPIRFIQVKTLPTLRYQRAQPTAIPSAGG